MFNNFYGLDLHKEACFVVANQQKILSKNQIENHTAHDLVLIIKSACLLILNRMLRSSQLCSLPDEDLFIKAKDIGQSLLNIRFHGVCSLILTKPHTNQI